MAQFANRAARSYNNDLIHAACHWGSDRQAVLREDEVRPSMNSNGLKRWLCLTASCTLASGCAILPDGARTAHEITAILGRQAEAWNTGDIEAFMQPYDRSPDLTFSSAGRVTRGWQATLDNYRKRYPTRDAMGHLTFGDLEVTELNRNAALVLGRWNLQRQAPVGGTFTLVLQKKAGGWKIIHDHTSRDPG